MRHQSMVNLGLEAWPVQERARGSLGPRHGPPKLTRARARSLHGSVAPGAGRGRGAEVAPRAADRGGTGEKLRDERADGCCPREEAAREEAAGDGSGEHTPSWPTHGANPGHSADALAQGGGMRTHFWQMPLPRRLGYACMETCVLRPRRSVIVRRRSTYVDGLDAWTRGPELSMFQSTYICLRACDFYHPSCMYTCIDASSMPGL